jgi:tetratricopeptide (TPR) repeat protein
MKSSIPDDPFLVVLILMRAKPYGAVPKWPKSCQVVDDLLVVLTVGKAANHLAHHRNGSKQKPNLCPYYRPFSPPSPTFARNPCYHFGVREAVRAGQSRRVRLLLDLGRPADALDATRRLLAENPNDPEGLELEGLCHLRLGDREAALKSLGSSIARGPERAHPHYLYGFTLRELGRSSQAATPLAEALRLSPDEPVYLRALAELYSDLGRHPEALKLGRRATEVAADRSANHVTYGYVASAAGDKVLARAEYERAVQLDPSDSAAWNNLGCLDLAAGRPLKARARFREALRLDPRGERAARNLALVAREGRPARNWSEVLVRLMEDLLKGSVANVKMVALALEAPETATTLLAGGEKGAAIAGAALLVALRMMGGAAILPLGAGAAMAGVVWLRHRDQLPRTRERVREVLAAGRVEYDRLWQEWLAGRSSRTLRDREITFLVEKMALEIVEHE